MIGTDSQRKSGKSVISAQHDDDESLFISIMVNTVPVSMYVPGVYKKYLKDFSCTSYSIVSQSPNL